MTQTYNEFFKFTKIIKEKKQKTSSNEPLNFDNDKCVEQVNVAGYNKDDLNVYVEDEKLHLVNTNPDKHTMEVEVSIPEYTDKIEVSIKDGMATIDFIKKPKKTIEVDLI